MRNAWIVSCLLGCVGSSPSPELVSASRSLQEWRAGSEHLANGDAAGALASFDRALQSRPDDPLLLAWRGRALAEGGDLSGAVGAMDAALARAPSFAEAAYNRAAYLARLGRVDEAGVALKHALSLGAADPRDVLQDPDFMPHLDHVALAFLPKAPITARLKGPGGSVFVGSDAVVRLQVSGLALDGVVVEGPTAAGPFRMSGVEERLERPSGADEQLILTWTLRALGPGSLVVGPLVLRDGPRTVTVDSLTLVSVTDRDESVPALKSPSWQRPKTLARIASQPPPAPSAWRRGSALWAALPPGSQVTGPDATPPDFRATRVVDRQEQWVIYRWDNAPADASIEAVRGGTVLLSGAVPLD